jgi:hypothetical protein
MNQYCDEEAQNMERLGVFETELQESSYDQDVKFFEALIVSLSILYHPFILLSS